MLLANVPSVSPRTAFSAPTAIGSSRAWRNSSLFMPPPLAGPAAFFFSDPPIIHATPAPMAAPPASTAAIWPMRGMAKNAARRAVREAVRPTAARDIIAVTAANAGPALRNPRMPKLTAVNAHPTDTIATPRPTAEAVSVARIGERTGIPLSNHDNRSMTMAMA